MALPRYITLIEPRAYLQKSHQFNKLHFVEIGSIFGKGYTVRMVRTIGWTGGPEAGFGCKFGRPLPVIGVKVERCPLLGQPLNSLTFNWARLDAEGGKFEADSHLTAKFVLNMDTDNIVEGCFCFEP